MMRRCADYLGLALVVQACCFASAADANKLDLASLEARIQAVSAQVAPSIVRFGYGDERKLWFGSGVIVTPEGHVAVNGPVWGVLKNELLELRTADGRRLKGAALGWSSSLGIGLLKITDAGPWPHVEISGNRHAGDFCFALGFPSAPELDSAEQRPSIRFGVITENSVPYSFSTSYRFLAGVHGIFNLHGQLIGWNSSTPVSSDPIHVPAELVRTHWDKLLAGKNLDREWMGKAVTESPVATLGSTATVPVALQRIIAKATASSVRITVPGDKGAISGTVITADGYVATCGHHRWLSGDKVDLAFVDGHDEEAVVLGKNLISDVGLMKLTGNGPWPHVELGDSSLAIPGTKCVRIGFPVSRPGRAPWVQEAKVILPTSTLPRRDDWYGQFWTDGFSPGMGGASGGGVFNCDGSLIGIIQGGVGDEAQQVRVELLRSEWDVLSDGRPVEVLKSEPLAEIKSAFEPWVEKQSSIAVKLKIQGKQQALGTIVRSDGIILTRADIPEGDITCELSDGRSLVAKRGRCIPEHNLLFLKIDAAGLPIAEWTTQESLAPGCLLAAIVHDRQPMIGVVSNFGKCLRRAELLGTLIGTDLQLRTKACGGPVVDRTGQVIGISIEGQSLPSGLEECLLVPANVITKLVADLEKNE